MKRFSLNRDNTVTDHLLNLSWKRLPGALNIKNAKASCEKSGFRLPSDKEILSLIDREDIVKLLRIKSGEADWYWTGTANSSREFFAMNFRDNLLFNLYRTTRNYVLAVRSARFTRNRDGTVHDSLLKIDWKHIPKKLTFIAAKCDTVGFHLPSDQQMESLIDRSKPFPSVVEGAEILGVKRDGHYWTDVKVGEDFQIFHFSGSRNISDIKGELYTLAVR